MNRQTNPKLGLLLAMAVLVGEVRPLISQETRPNQWVVRFQAGAAPIKLGSKLKLTIDKEKVLLESKKGPSFSIPAAGITEVSSNLVSSHTASLVQAGLWVAAVKETPYTLLFLPFGLGAMAATYPIKSHYAYINILWNEKGTEQEVVLMLNRRDYTQFIAELQKATGKEWKNLDTEWEKVQQELKREAGNNIPVRLDRKVRIAKSDLKPGTYQLVLLEREGNRGELYFFPGNQVNIEHLAAVAMIEIATIDDTKADPISYKEDENGVTTLSEIRISNKILRFP